MSNNYWELRVQNIKEAVSLRKIIDYYNIPCQSTGEITQVHCPFHGNDQHASARIYETNTMYCWVCSKMWDAISFIRDYKNISFAESCTFLEDMFNVSKVDKAIAYHEESFNDFLSNQDPVKEKDFEKDFEKISSVLIANKKLFTLEDYVKYFYFFDNLYINYRANNHSDDFSLEESLSKLFKEISNKI